MIDRKKCIPASLQKYVDDTWANTQKKSLPNLQIFGARRNWEKYFICSRHACTLLQNVHTSYRRCRSSMSCASGSKQQQWTQRKKKNSISQRSFFLSRSSCFVIKGEREKNAVINFILRNFFNNTEIDDEVEVLWAVLSSLFFVVGCVFIKIWKSLFMYVLELIAVCEIDMNSWRAFKFNELKHSASIQTIINVWHVLSLSTTY